MRVYLKTTRKGTGLKPLTQAQKKCRAKIGYPNNPEIADRAAHNEYGWVQTVKADKAGYFLGQFHVKVNVGTTLYCPPRPFFRATFRECDTKWRDEFAAGLKRLGITGLSEVVEGTAKIAWNDVLNTIVNGGTESEKFPERSGLTMKIYANAWKTLPTGRRRKISSFSSARTTKPLTLTGEMLRALAYEIENG